MKKQILCREAEGKYIQIEMNGDKDGKSCRTKM